MEIYPFFIECSKYYDNFKSKQLQRLAIGQGALIVSRKCEKVLITANDEFVIPERYSDSERIRLEEKLWSHENTDFHKMQKEIRESRKTWVNTKKKEKLRLLDNYIFSEYENQPIDEILFVRSVIKLAMILKLIKNQDIVYKDFKVVSVEGKFDSHYFDKMNFVKDYSKFSKKSVLVYFSFPSECD